MHQVLLLTIILKRKMASKYTKRRRKEREFRDARKKGKAGEKQQKKEIKVLNNKGEVVRIIKP